MSVTIKGEREDGVFLMVRMIRRKLLLAGLLFVACLLAATQTAKPTARDDNDHEIEERQVWKELTV